MKKKLVLVLAMGLSIIGMAGIANATAIQWTSGSGANNHWYDVITTTSTISWEESRDNAVLAGWHLVTIANAEEDIFVANLLGSQMTTNAENYWLGGYQPIGSLEPSGGWSWVTGETWIYSNWASGLGEPNNGAGGTQNYLHYWPEGTWLWDDMENRSTMVGYVIEKNAVPEPSTMLLLGNGLLGLVGLNRRRKA